MDLILALVVWVGLAIAAGAIAKSKSRTFFGYLVLTLLLPLIGLIVAIGVSNRTPPPSGKTKPGRDEKPCPMCAETIKKAAVKCKHCGADLSTGQVLPSAV